MDCGESESVSGKTFMADVRVKTAETLGCIIKEWYYYSKNCWVAYSTLQDDGYTQTTVNRSTAFATLLITQILYYQSNSKTCHGLTKCVQLRADYILQLIKYMSRNKWKAKNNPFFKFMDTQENNWAAIPDNFWKWQLRPYSLINECLRYENSVVLLFC